MDIFSAILQGIIQGLTEFLPVSSSGHLAITQHIIGMQGENLFFSVMLHIGTLAAVLAVYFKLIIRLVKAFGLMVKDIFTGKFKWSEMDSDRNLVMMIIIGLVPLFLLFLPVGTDMKLKDLADKWTSDGYLIISSLALITTSLLLYIGNRANHKTAERYKAKGLNPRGGAGRKRYNAVDAAIVGFTQCLAAIFPGLSRSGSTLTAGELRGINKQAALDYSFVLGIPAIIAAAVLEGKDALFPPDGTSVSIEYFPVIVGMITAAVVGFFAIKLFRWLLSTDRMYIFILYTAVIGGVMFIISIIELFLGTNVFTGNALSF
ncbi:MAG: undecaprenyl-diphosphate phosphatase [Acutalibacteraceae bacterium]